MSKATTTRYDVAEHLRTPEEMAAYLEACLAGCGKTRFIDKPPLKHVHVELMLK